MAVIVVLVRLIMRTRFYSSSSGHCRRLSLETDFPSNPQPISVCMRLYVCCEPNESASAANPYTKLRKHTEGTYQIGSGPVLRPFIQF